MRRSIISFTNYRWIPWVIVGCFLVVIAVNGAFAYFALESDTGLVSEHPFELGNGYNRVLDMKAAEDALGWQGAATFSPTSGLSGSIVASLNDAAGTPLDGLLVKAEVVRPIEPLPPQDVTLLSIGQGKYSAPITLLRRGQWELRITAERGADSYEFVSRVVVR